MRITLTLLIWIFCLGSVTAYMHSRTPAVTADTSAPAARAATDRYCLEVTTTFAVAPDPFALRVADASAPAALSVTLGHREILRITDELPAGRPLTVDPLPGLVIGRNELFCTASPPLDQADRAHALRMTVLRNGQPFASDTLWSTPGSTVSGRLYFTIKADIGGTHD